METMAEKTTPEMLLQVEAFSIVSEDHLYIFNTQA